MTVTSAWLLAAGPAGAQTAQGKAPADQIVLSGRVVVPRGETVGEIIVLRGRAVVAGVATRDVVVVNGPVAVSGQVSGDVVALAGDVTLADSAQIGGDVLAAGDVHQGAGAQVGGEVRPHQRFTLRDRFGAIARLISWFAVSVSVLLLGLLLLWLVPTGSDRVVEAGRTAPWASILWGLAAAVLVPAIAVAFLASVIALPLGLAAILALAFFVMLGYAFGAMLLGRIVVRGRSRSTCFLVGWVILRAVGLIPIVSGITVALVAVVGIGASLVAIWRARGRGLGGRHRPGRATSAGHDPVVDLVEEESSTGFA
jgi:hypothetical protein